MSIAYLAGFFDGEGCFAIHSKRQRGRKVQLAPAVFVVQTSREPLDLFRKRYGGQVRERSKTSIGRTAWVWQLYGFKAVSRLVKEISPFLVVKKKEAALLSRFLKTVGVVGQRSSEKVHAERQALRDSLMSRRKRD